VGERKPLLATKAARQLGSAARLDFLFVVRGRATVLIWLLTDFVSYTSGTAAVLLIAERFQGIAGWSKSELVFLIGFSTTAAALQQVLFGYNLATISRRIGRGQLDHVLIQPQPLLLCFLTEGFSPFSSLGALIPGITLVVLGGVASHMATVGFFVKTAVCCLSSMAILLSSSYILGSAAFWAPRGAEELSTRASALLLVTNFPLDPLPRGLRTILTTILPVGLVAWFPASVLLGRRPPWEWILTPLAACVAASIAAIVFKIGLRRYERTGSSRYSTFGHRR
jgi:ABC-2 type transport system permease protein